MIYHSIEELNIADAVRRLRDARETNNPEQTKIATEHLREQLLIIQHSKPELYVRHASEISQNEG